MHLSIDYSYPEHLTLSMFPCPVTYHFLKEKDRSDYQKSAEIDSTFFFKYMSFLSAFFYVYKKDLLKGHFMSSLEYQTLNKKFPQTSQYVRYSTNLRLFSFLHILFS